MKRQNNNLLDYQAFANSIFNRLSTEPLENIEDISLNFFDRKWQTAENAGCAVVEGNVRALITAQSNENKITTDLMFLYCDYVRGEIDMEEAVGKAKSDLERTMSEHLRIQEEIER